MGFKTGLVLGAAAGYVLGAKAGRERYQQIVEQFNSLARSDRLQWLTKKGRSALDETTDRLRAMVSERRHPVSDAEAEGHAAP